MYTIRAVTRVEKNDPKNDDSVHKIFLVSGQRLWQIFSKKTWKIWNSRPS